ncbi:4Fe-4S binding protein [Candidatus Parcubacteria bacterium]|jgi:iron-only hydrogenase group A|nr:4Fe-4S binding protein [Candidatus Parcubacteria bacterium]
MKQKNISIKIDGKLYKAKEGQSILDVARKNKIRITTLCHHPDVKVQASCRLCLVEIKDKKGLFTSCSTQASDGMEVTTHSESISRAKKINLELIFTEHCEECSDCVYRYGCHIKDLAKKYDVKITKFPDRKKGKPVHEFGPALIFDSSKCIDCGICVDICEKVGACFLEYEKVGKFHEVMPSKDKYKDCIYCGQCITHCPVGAFEGVGEFEDIDNPLKLKEEGKTVVFQFAPSIRSTIGEEFDMPYGSIVTGRLTAAIKQLGIKHVFDVSVGADVTTVEEAKELIERIEKGGTMPMFTSCCPGWVKYLEFYYPEFIPHLTSVRSPQVIMGGLIKTYWAQENKIDPKDIVVVSIMPCVAKKYEIERPEVLMGDIKPVDHVLTTREFAQLLKKHKIDLKNVKAVTPDPFLGAPTGAGVIYGASGGVMESALRTAYNKITGKKLPRLDLEEVRGLEGCKKATIDIDGKPLKVGVVNGAANAKKILEELKKDPKAYDYVEMMACFGGCIGGGGQPMPVNDEIRKKRAEGLYNVDSRNKIRMAEESAFVKALYKDFLKDHDNVHLTCHTSFSKKDKEVYPKNK